jgi:hypothetical protein
VGTSDTVLGVGEGGACEYRGCACDGGRRLLPSPGYRLDGVGVCVAGACILEAVPLVGPRGACMESHTDGPGGVTLRALGDEGRLG